MFILFLEENKTIIIKVKSFSFFYLIFVPIAARNKLTCSRWGERLDRSTVFSLHHFGKYRAAQMWPTRKKDLLKIEPGIFAILIEKLLQKVIFTTKIYLLLTYISIGVVARSSDFFVEGHSYFVCGRSLPVLKMQHDLEAKRFFTLEKVRVLWICKPCVFFNRLFFIS